MCKAKSKKGKNGLEFRFEVILVRERTPVQTERNRTRLVRLCEELAIIHEELRQYK